MLVWCFLCVSLQCSKCVAKINPLKPHCSLLGQMSPYSSILTPRGVSHLHPPVCPFLQSGWLYGVGRQCFTGRGFLFCFVFPFLARHKIKVPLPADDVLDSIHDSVIPVLQMRSLRPPGSLWVPQPLGGGGELGTWRNLASSRGLSTAPLGCPCGPVSPSAPCTPDHL